MLHRFLARAALAAAVLAGAAGSAQAPAAAAQARPCSAPQRIVSISPTATEMLYAIGAGPRVVAVDDQSDYPRSAPRTSLSGYRPNAEAIAARRPDLVVLAEDANGVVRQLRAVGIRTLRSPAAATLADTYREIRQLGRVTCRARQAARLVGRMRARIAAIVRAFPRPSRTLTYFHELDPSLYTATSRTFVGQLYGLLGLRNIADGADPGGSGYPQLSAEYVISADPDVVFLADTECCRQGPASVAARPGWASITAVRTGAVIPEDDDIASRWGPRVVDFLRTVARRVAPLVRGATG